MGKLLGYESENVRGAENAAREPSQEVQKSAAPNRKMIANDAVMVNFRNVDEANLGKRSGVGSPGNIYRISSVNRLAYRTEKPASDKCR